MPGESVYTVKMAKETIAVDIDDAWKRRKDLAYDFKDIVGKVHE